MSDSETTDDECEPEVLLYDRSTRRDRHKLTRLDDFVHNGHNVNDEEPLMQRVLKDGKLNFNVLC